MASIQQPQTLDEAAINTKNQMSRLRSIAAFESISRKCQEYT